jgi:transmembrane sensor
MSGKDETRRDADGDNAQAEAVDRVLHAHWTGVHPEDDLTAAAWRRENEAHDAAFRNAAQAWDGAALLKHSPTYADLLGTPTLRERVVAWWHSVTEFRPQFAPSRGFAFASVLAVVIVTGALFLTPREPDFSTQVAEIRDVPLDDGSVVTLGAKSALDVKFSQDERTVRLAGGEAFFSVSKNAARPFVVLAGDTRIRVVGTKFNVNYDGGRVRVSVLEGVVEVMRGDGGTERVTSGNTSGSMVKLIAGQQVVALDSVPLPKAEPLNGAEPGVWREGRLSYQDAPLSEIVADANRYRAGQIRIMSPLLTNERLTTSFRTSQIDQMLDTLPDTLPLIVQRKPDGSIELRRGVPSGS